MLANDEVLAVAQARIGDLAVLVLRGEVTAETAEVLQRAVHDGLESGARRVDLDLAAVSFLDSGGLSALLAVRTRLQAAQRSLRLASPSTIARRVFESTGLTSVFEFTDRA